MMRAMLIVKLKAMCSIVSMFSFFVVMGSFVG